MNTQDKMILYLVKVITLVFPFEMINFGIQKDKLFIALGLVFLAELVFAALVDIMIQSHPKNSCETFYFDLGWVGSLSAYNFRNFGHYTHYKV